MKSQTFTIPPYKYGSGKKAARTLRELINSYLEEVEWKDEMYLYNNKYIPKKLEDYSEDKNM